MCGIAGILSKKLDNHAIAPKLGAMQEALNHRGPDGRGDYFSPSGHAGLAHTRLSIIDLSDNGAQPMSSHNDRYTISFNGEIYNYQTLREELIQQGHTFQSQSDTEVILNSYIEFGDACVNKLRGMFAFVIWDEQEQSAFAARDPFGIKPFYYWHDQNSFAFASEIKAVMQSGLNKKTLSSQGVFSYFKTGSVSEPYTLINDIQLLQAGHTLSWKDGQVSKNRYWAIDFPESKQYSREVAIQKTRSALIDSLNAHLVADVPVGIFLSGGIDSTALLALASSISTTPINTYSIAFENPEWNEGDIAQRIADHFGANHTELIMTPSLAQTLFDDYINAIDQPSIDGFNTFCVSKLAHDNNEKVVLSGLGGDELFAGYKSFELLPKMQNASRRFALLSDITCFMGKHLKRWLPTKLNRVMDFLSQPNSLIAAQQSLRGIFSHHEALTLTQEITAQDQLSITNPYEPKHQHIKDNVSDIELSTYMRNQLLRDSDSMSMYWGLELRVPFIDSVLFDEVSSIPADLRLEQGKQLLIDSVPEIPEWVSNRPKQGFRFPFDEWFSKNWQHSVIDFNTPTWIKLKPWYRRWSLVVLSDWVKRYAK